MTARALDLAAYLREVAIDAEIVAPGMPMPSVESAAAAMGCGPERIFKSILFQDARGTCALAIACGLSRVDATKLAALAHLERPRLAPPDVVLRVTGYPAGGTPPVGHRERLTVVVDEHVVAQAWGYAGGGREELLVRIAAADIVRLTGARVADVTRAVTGSPPA